MKFIAAIIIAFLLTACGNDALLDSDRPFLSQKIYVNPSNIGLPSDYIYSFFAGDSIFLESDVTYKFSSAYFIDGIYSSDNSNSIKSLLWNIDGNYFNIGTVQYSFETTGQKKGYLESVDLLGDTARTEFNLFVNTPNKITLESPSDKYNQVEVNSELSLKWNISGLDPWESANCTVYASEQEQSIWQNNLGTVDCTKNVTLNKFGDANKFSSTIFWAVIMEVNSVSGKIYYDTSSVFSFSTRPESSKYSLLTIPISYGRTSSENPLETEIILEDAKGDTLQAIKNSKNYASHDIFVTPQSGLKIIAREKRQTEFKSEIQIIDVPKSSAVLVDTIRFVDNTPPQIAPQKTSFKHGENLTFTIYDNGSGINPSKISVISENDTLSHYFNSSTLTVSNHCSTKCKIYIVGEDYAQNQLPQNYWIIKNDLSTVNITGPFAMEDEQ